MPQNNPDETNAQENPEESLAAAYPNTKSYNSLG